MHFHNCPGPATVCRSGPVSRTIDGPGTSQRLIRRGSAVLASLAVLGFSAASAAPAARAKPAPAAARTVNVTAAGVADLTKATDPETCLDVGICAHAGPLPLKLTGDISGSGTVIGTSTYDPTHTHNTFAGQAVVTGTVKGCGSGTFLLSYSPTFTDKQNPPTLDERGNVKSGPARFEINPFPRTGDFTTLTGNGVLVLKGLSPASIEFTLAGTLRCAAKSA